MKQILSFQVVQLYLDTDVRCCVRPLNPLFSFSTDECRCQMWYITATRTISSKVICISGSGMLDGVVVAAAVAATGEVVVAASIVVIISL